MHFKAELWKPEIRRAVLQERFSPAKYSQVLLAIAMLVQVLVALMMNGLTPEGYGAIAGAMIVTLAFCVGVAYVVWRISGKRERPASIALSVTAGFLIVSPIAAYLIPQLIPSRLDREMAEAKERLQIQRESGDPVKIHSAQTEYAETVTRKLDDIATKSSGTKAEVYTIVGDATREVAAHSQAWRATVVAAMKPEIMDLDFLAVERNYEAQIAILTTYTETTGTYKRTMAGAFDALRDRLRPVGLDNEEVKGVLKGYKEGWDRKSPVFLPLLDAHSAYGESMLNLLKFLRDVDADWALEDGEPRFETDAQVDKFTDLIAEVVRCEETMNQLDQKLVELG